MDFESEFFDGVDDLVNAIRERLAYDPETGILAWRERPISFFKSERIAKCWNTKNAGKPVGTMGKFGYLLFNLFGKTRRVNVIAFIIYHGRLPVGDVDHENRKRDDNRIKNLREATRSQNICNSKRRSTNKSGFKGVIFIKDRNIWQARIVSSGKQTYLGAFDSPEKAHAAYCEAADKLHGAFANHG